MNCYTLEALVRIREEQGSQAEVEAHIESCEDCADLWNAAGEALDLIADAASRKPISDRLRGALLSIPDAANRPGTRELVVDAEPTPRAEVAIRGAGTELLRQRLYELGDFDVDVSLDDSGLLRGQVLPCQDAGTDAVFPAGAYCLVYDGSGARSVALSPYGAFEMPGVSSGPFDLVVESDGLRLVLRGVRFDGGNGAR